MKKFILSSLFVSALANATQPALPSSIVRQIPRGYTVIESAEGDLTGSGQRGYLVALAVKNETFDSLAPRPLLLFLQQTPGVYALKRRNDHVIMISGGGGQCDPFLDNGNGFAIKNGYFTVQNGVACGEHWTDFITFHYDRALNDWVFHKEIFESQKMGNDPNGDALVPDIRKVTKANRKSPTLFVKYRLRE